MTQDLDALPLPELPTTTYLGDGSGYGYDATDMHDYARAARREGYELAKREALEGREPVASIPRAVKVDAGFRFDPVAQQHVPTLLVEFTPVPVDGSSDAQGWNDRDALAAIITPPPPKSDARMIERLKSAIEGECDGLTISDQHAKAILEYVFDVPLLPKIDEARGAVIRAAQWFADNKDSPKSAYIHIAEALAALAAQKKGGK